LRIPSVIPAICLVFTVSCAGGGGGVEEGSHERIVRHKVLPGQSWESIAGEYYGDPSRGEKIARFNDASEDIPPRAGSGIRVPIYEADIDRIDARLKAASQYNMGLELARAGNYNGAAGKFRETLRLDPSFHDAALNLSVAFRKLGKNDEAAAVLEDLVSRVPGRTVYWFALGNSRFHNGQYPEAEAAFEKALDIDPDHLESIYSLAVTLEKMGETERAIGMWKWYLVLDPESEWAEEASIRLRKLE
jgi:tetratricopeptide (TPR) repeat protein